MISLTLPVIATGTKNIFDNPYFEFVFSKESPWVAAFGSKDTVLFRDNHFVLTNMESDPTVFYSLMRLGGLAAYGVYGAAATKYNPKSEILLSKMMFGDPRRLAGQKPIIKAGLTWSAWVRLYQATL